MRKPQPVALPDAGRRRVRAFHGGFQVRGGEGIATLGLYDAIGMDGVTAAQMRRTLDGIRAPRILLRIDSPGGDVFDGIAIYNDLVSHPAEVTVEVTGVAASAASVVAMAGDRVSIAESAFLMIHRSWAFALGNAADMRETAGVLEKIDASLANIYAGATGQTVAQVSAWMEAETWFSGREAVAAGFADATTGEKAPARAFDFGSFGHVPPQLKRRNEQALRESGLSRREARLGAAGGLEPDEDDTELLDALEALAANMQGAG